MKEKIDKVFDILPESRLVGGCVRDTLLGITPKDYDFATPILPEVVTDIFQKEGYGVIPTGLQHGTITVVIDKEPFEITTLRKDVETDGRHAEVKFVQNWEEDALRRDFTFNALYMDKDGQIYDYFNGQDDLKNKIVRFVGNAEDRIQEDALRILRYYRFVSRFEAFNLEPEATQAIANNKNMISHLSVERIFSELKQIFNNVNQGFILNEFQKNNLDTLILGPNGINNWFDYVDISQPNYLKSFSLIADQKDYLKKFKVSSYENDFINAVIDNNILTKSSFEIQKLLFQNYSREVLQAKALLNGLGDIPEIETLEKPVFPLRGADFVAKGYKGIEVGAKMRESTQKWIDSNFTLTKEKLLKQPELKI